MRRSNMVTAVLCGLVLAAGGVLASERIDLNTASAQELARLPGIGPAKAEAIVQHRAQQPFARPDDLRKVKGIGDKLYDRVKDQVTVGGAAPPQGRGG
jgi:competence protein ComEA